MTKNINQDTSTRKKEKCMDLYPVSDEQNKAYYAVIPANVRYDAELPPNAKLLYGEITALCNQNGYCWASNEYFASLYKCGKRSVTRWIAQLAGRGYIRVELIKKPGKKEIENRYIKLCDTPIDKNGYRYSQNVQYPIDKNGDTPIDKNGEENITSSFNNTSNKKKERKHTRYDEILSTVPDDLKEFYLEFIKMRKLIKSPMTDRALIMLINKVNELEPLDIDRQKQMLETAILNNWKSVYPLREEKKNTHSADKPNEYSAFMDQLAAMRE